jgi:flagellar M-ring protein FliF
MLYVQLGAGILLAIIFLIVILRIRSRKGQKLGTADIASEQKLVTLEEAEQILASQLEAERMAELKLARKKVKTPDEIEKDKIRQEIDKFSKENPDDVG